MYVTYLTLLALLIACNCVLLFIFYRHTQKNFTTVSLTILLVLLTIWHLPKLITNAFHPNDFWFETLSRIAALGYIFSPVAIFLFVLSFCLQNKLFRKIWFWFFLFAPPIIFLFLSWSTNLVGVHELAQATLYSWGYETPTGPLWPLYIAWYDILIFCSIYTLITFYRNTLDASKRDQTLFFIVAISLPFVISSISIGILPMFGIFVFPVGLILVNIMSVLCIALIYRYGWFEVSPFTILSSLNYAIFTVDINGNILQLNHSAERLLRTRSTELVNTSIDKILHVQDKKSKKKNHTMQLLKNVFAKGKSMTYDSLAVHVDNKHKLLHTISITPIYSQNVIVGASVFLRDVSKEKVREKQKDDYFSMLSHELKHPISSIKLYNQLLSTKYARSSEEKQLIEKVDKQVDKVTRLINDFFELTRLQNGKLRLAKEVIDLDAFVHDIVETAQVTYKDRRIVIEGHSASLIYADKDRIEQVIVNFISNAIKFSATDKQIIVHLVQDKKNAIVSVEDFGKGIDPKFHKKIFEHYYQVDRKAAHQKGLGIGLYLSNAIIKTHGGKVWVKSNPGKGSTFYFSLPISK
jgi:PAS domain S-box-containing protein